jgi:hypothetical protein
MGFLVYELNCQCKKIVGNFLLVHVISCFVNVIKVLNLNFFLFVNFSCTENYLCAVLLRTKKVGHQISVCFEKFDVPSSSFVIFFGLLRYW